MITVIIISACLGGTTPVVCKEFRATMEETVTTSQCLMSAPQQIAMWSKQNPGWEFRRVTCTPQERDNTGRVIADETKS